MSLNHLSQNWGPVQRFPERLGQAQKVVAIPRKRARPPETIFLDRDEIESTLAALPQEGRYALRDRTLLIFLYNTGARVQETADLRVTDIHFDPSPRVHLHGKGDKWRVCPLWEETANLLNKLLTEHGWASAPDQLVFTGATDAALTRFGIYKIIRRYTTHVVRKRADGRLRPVSPHVWRHSTAVHLLEAGVEVNVIRVFGWAMQASRQPIGMPKLLSEPNKLLWKDVSCRRPQTRGFRGNLFGKPTPRC